MNPISMIGAFIVTLSLLSYGIGSISILRFKVVSPMVLLFLSMGVIFDIIAITFMTIGSGEASFSLHTFLGFSALLVMLVEVILIWRIYLKEKLYAEIGVKILAYSRLAISWWIIAYITGSLLVIV
jgi:hypothetical protein